MTHTLIVGGLLALASATVFAIVGRVIHRRPVSQAAELAAKLFAVWWYGLAATTAIGGLQSLAAAGGLTNLNVYIAITYVNIAVICVALLGLLYYLGFLVTGKRSLIWPLAIFYVLYYVYLVYTISTAGPIGVEIEAWRTTIEYERPIAEGAAGAILVLLLVAPQILAAMGYLGLIPRAENASQRYRIAVVGSSIIIWFGAALVGSFAGLSDFDWWQLLSRFIGLSAALAILLAYLPPLWVRRRFGIEAVEVE